MFRHVFKSTCHRNILGIVIKINFLKVNLYALEEQGPLLWWKQTTDKVNPVSPVTQPSQTLTVFVKASILNVWQDSEYAFESYSWAFAKITYFTNLFYFLTYLRCEQRKILEVCLTIFPIMHGRLKTGNSKRNRLEVLWKKKSFRKVRKFLSNICTKPVCIEWRFFLLK